jgi:DNA-directed RNA polymerase specialized sigma24 family protein
LSASRFRIPIRFTQADARRGPSAPRAEGDAMSETTPREDVWRSGVEAIYHHALRRALRGLARGGRIGVHSYEDLLQELICKHLAALRDDKLRDPHRCLWQMARRLVIDARRREEVRLSAPLERDGKALDVEDDGPAPDASLIYQDAVRALLDSFTEPERVVFDLARSRGRNLLCPTDRRAFREELALPPLVFRRVMNGIEQKRRRFLD